MNLDELIKERVDEVLFKSMDNADVGINTAVKNGHVILSGIVDTLAEKRYAAELVQKLPGVKGIENSLTVSMDGKIDDNDIARVIMDHLMLEPRLRNSLLGLVMNQGVAYLKGIVNTLAELELAETLASTVMGVKEVVNQIKIKNQPEDRLDDASLTNEVERVFSASDELSADDIKTSCRDRVIHLAGNVRSQQGKEAAEHLAKTVAGVRRVINELTVEH